MAPKGVQSDAGALRRASGTVELYNGAVTVEEVWAAIERAIVPSPLKSGPAHDTGLSPYRRDCPHNSAPG